jgi:hypothetical protein
VAAHMGHERLSPFDPSGKCVASRCSSEGRLIVWPNTERPFSEYRTFNTSNFPEFRRERKNPTTSH